MILTTILCIDKIKFTPYRLAADLYIQRLKHSLPITEIELKSSAAKNLSPDEIKKKEAQAIISAIPPNSSPILLDENGTQFSSLQLAKFLQKNIDNAINTTFIIGGAYGHHKDLKNHVTKNISLSLMTFPHELARVMLCEQLYRAVTILNNSPYHK